MAKRGEAAFKEFYFCEGNLGLGEEDFERMMESMKRPLLTTFRTNTLLPYKEGVWRVFRKYPFITEQKWKEGVFQVDTGKKELRSNPLYSSFREELIRHSGAGSVTRQEIVSMLPVVVLDVKKDSRVLDMCAAPGSKSSQILELLGERGVLVANDVNRDRAELLVANAKRICSASLVVTRSDASAFPGIRSESKELLRFDRVLCDVPCSGDGTLRKNPDILGRWSLREAKGLFDLQKRILRRGIELLKAGGLLVYSTCSLNPIENEMVVREVLKECSAGREKGEEEGEAIGLEKVDIPGFKVREGLRRWSVEGVVHEEKEMPLERCGRVYPHDQDTGGFFIAVLRKGRGTTVDGTQDKEVEGERVMASAPLGNTLIREESGGCDSFYEVGGDVSNSIRLFYGFLPRGEMVCRSSLANTIHSVSPPAKEVIKYGSPSLKVVYAGQRVFTRYGGEGGRMEYRLNYQGISAFDRRELESSRHRVEMEREKLLALLEQSVQQKVCSEAFGVPRGSVLISNGELGVFLPACVGEEINLMVDLNERKMLCSVLKE